MDFDLSAYSYSDIGDKIINACSDYPPDFKKITDLLNTGFDLNTLSPHGYNDNMLSDIIDSYPSTRELRYVYCESCREASCEDCDLNYPEADGRYLPYIVKLFLEHGFDCSKDNGKAGAQCLANLISSSSDKYILDAAKLLLEAGADPNFIIFDDTNESVLEYVKDESSSVLMIYDTEDNINEYELSNLFSTLYEIMFACIHKNCFSDICYYDKASGRKIDHIILYSKTEKSQGIFSDGKHTQCFFDHIVFWCEDSPLCISTHGDILCDPRIPSKAKAAKNIEEYFPDCAGNKIDEIKLGKFTINRDGKPCIEELICIRTDNGKTILFPLFSREKLNDKAYSYFDVI